MKSRGVSKQETAFLRGVSLLAIGVYLTLMGASRATGAPPQRDPNEQAERINQKFDKVHSNLSKFLDNAIASEGVFDADQIKYFQNGRVRADKAKQRFHDEGGFKQVGRKNNFDKEQREKEDYDANAFDEFEGAIDDLDQIIVDANSELTNGKKSMRMYTMLAAAGEVDKCQDLVDNCVALGISASVVRGLTIAANTAYCVCDAFAQQTSFGWNASSVSAVFAVVVGVLDICATGLEIADGWVASDLQAACLNQIDNAVYDIQSVTEGTSEDVNELAEAVGRLNTLLAGLSSKIEDVNRMVEKKFAEQNKMLDERFYIIELLLNMPQGQRPLYPQK